MRTGTNQRGRLNQTRRPSPARKLRPQGWAPGLLALGLIGGPVPALAQETITLATDTDVVIQGAAAFDLSGRSVSEAGDVDGDGLADLIIGAELANPNGRFNAAAPAAGADRPDLTVSRRGFLEPIEPHFVISRAHPLFPQLCSRRRDLRCPRLVSRGGGGGGGIPQLEPRLTSRLPNVRVSFLVQEIGNEVVANGGVETDLVFVGWVTTGSEADIEDGGPYGWSLPGPGEIWDTTNVSPHSLMIYDALVFGACDTLTSFDVEHEATIEEDFTEIIGSFEAVDTTTIDQTGYYNFSYTVRAESSEGGVSDFHFRGKANVICSGLNAVNALP